MRLESLKGVTTDLRMPCYLPGIRIDCFQSTNFRVLQCIKLLGEECYGAHRGIVADQSRLRRFYRRVKRSCCLYIENQAVQGDAARP